MGIRYTQPQTPVQIDWSNPLTRGLASVISAPINDVVVSTGTRAVAAYPKGIAFDGTMRITKGNSFDQGSSTTIAFIRTKALTGVLAVAASNDASPNTNRLWLGLQNDNTLRVSNSINDINFGAATANTDYAIAYINTGSTGYGYLNGNFVASGSHTLSGIGRATAMDYGTGGFAWTGVVYLVLGFSRPLSATEIKALSNNPWQIFKPTARLLWVVGAGGGLTVNCSLGTATANGFTATVDRQLTIAAALGTATANGLTASVDRQLGISASLGTATANGFIATVDRQLTIAATIGTATANGFTANVDRQLTVAATLGTAIADGFLANITFGSSLTVNCSVGTATADGFTANVDRQITIAALLGTATANGFTANVDKQITIAATLGTATANGFTANIVFVSGLTINCSVGTATANGFTANVDKQLSIAASLGTANANGFLASVDTLNKHSLLTGGDDAGQWRKEKKRVKKDEYLDTTISRKNAIIAAYKGLLEPETPEIISIEVKSVVESTELDALDIVKVQKLLDLWQDELNRREQDDEESLLMLL
jgi:invasion protein IalB